MEIFGFTKSPTAIALGQALADCPARLRWGGNKVQNAINGSASLLDGFEQLKRFGESAIPTVEWTNDPAVRDSWQQGGALLLGRKASHTQGYDIVIPGTFKSNQRWLKRDFWVKYMTSSKEWRIHILRNPRTGAYNSIARGLKTYTWPAGQPDPRPATWHHLGIQIRSRRLGWTLRHDQPPANPLRELAKNAVQACGYDLGAVDILELGPGLYRVLEVNSRPAVRDDYTLTAYTKAIRRWAGGEDGVQD